MSYSNTKASLYTEVLTAVRCGCVGPGGVIYDDAVTVLLQYDEVTYVKLAELLDCLPGEAALLARDLLLSKYDVVKSGADGWVKLSTTKE